MHYHSVGSPKLRDTLLPPAFGKLNSNAVVLSFEAAGDLHVTIVRVHAEEAVSTHLRGPGSEFVRLHFVTAVMICRL